MLCQMFDEVYFSSIEISLYGSLQTTYLDNFTMYESRERFMLNKKKQDLSAS